MLIKFKKQKGVSLFLALVVMTVFLSMGAGLGVVLIKQKKSIQGMDSSVVSFYAADSGIEKVFYLDSVGEPTDSVEGILGSVDARFKASLESDCSLKTVTSHGYSDTYGATTRRSIEVSIEVSGGGCMCGDTGWGDNLYGCEGADYRCYDGSCVQCGGWLYDDGCSGCAGQGGVACWYAGGFGANCDEACSNGCVAANWNATDGFVLSHFFSCHGMLSAGADLFPAYYTPFAFCYISDETISQSCASALGAFERVCTCNY